MLPSLILEAHNCLTPERTSAGDEVSVCLCVRERESERERVRERETQLQGTSTTSQLDG